MKSTSISLAVLGLLAMAAPAWADNVDFTWTGPSPGSGDWMDAGNWTGGPPGPPPFYKHTEGDPAVDYYGYATIDNGGTSLIGGSGAGVPNPSTGAYYLYVGTDAANTGHLVIDSTDGSTFFKTLRVYVRSGSGVAQNSGTWGDYGAMNSFNIEDGGIFDLAGGTFYARWCYYNVNISGEFLQTGGYFMGEAHSSSQGVLIAETGKYYIEAGSMKARGAWSKAGLYVQGVFQIHGSGAASITVDNQNGTGTSPAVYRQSGSLLIGIDSGGITPIECSAYHGGATDVAAEFEAGSDLKIYLIGGYTPNLGDYFDLLISGTGDNADGSIIGLPDWAPKDAEFDSALWTKEIISIPGDHDPGMPGQDYDQQILRVAYVPEPATLVLLGVGLIGVVCRRRKK